jgi:hypothetical protein
MANEEKAQSTGIDVGKPAAPTVDWDDSGMRSTYANVVNASSTREEVTLFFGTNETWNPTPARKFHVKLTDRIVLNPHAAKRLWVLLGAVLGEYEKRFGVVAVDGLTSGAGAATTRARTPGAAQKNGQSKTESTEPSKAD